MNHYRILNRTCVTPSGQFEYGVHTPRFRVHNLRDTDSIMTLGIGDNGHPQMNHRNFPPGNLEETVADTIFEIPNPFPFRGTTYIAKPWADAAAERPEDILLPPQDPVSLSAVLRRWAGDGRPARWFADLPQPLLVALAAVSTDPDDLTLLAEWCCRFDRNDTGEPCGLVYQTDAGGRSRPSVTHRAVFETLVNNPHLPDRYKEIMVLRPGVQGDSEIVGEWSERGRSHVFEYLRRNSYIPWGHYAANMAHDAVRYDIDDLSSDDMTALRHLYYQRTFVRLAEELGVPVPSARRKIDGTRLEALRRAIIDRLSQAEKAPPLRFNASLWGWNFGFDMAPTGYRLHASHQQVHQQFALLPDSVDVRRSHAPGIDTGETIAAYGCGDLIGDFVADYRERNGSHFFSDYFRAIRSNRRMDERTDRDDRLVVFQDDHVMLFVPKAQTSQWELNLVTLRPVGNVLEADGAVRASLDSGMLLAVKALRGLGARLITSIEYPKRFTSTTTDQHLLYAFLPRLPESPGAFSEAQLRWINGHYPEDFATACRSRLNAATTGE